MSKPESLSFSTSPDGKTQGVKIPVKKGKPRGLGKIIDQQISLSGREIAIHCQASDEPRYTIDPYHLEEARGFSETTRERFVNGVIHELKESTATSIEIRNSRE